MSYIGTTLEVTANVPAAEDESDYAALSWSEVGNVISYSAIGDTYEDQSVTILKTGRTKHSNGAADGGEFTIVIDGQDFTDAGLTILNAAEGTNTAHSFQFTDNEQIRYLQGIVRGVRTMEVNASNRAGIEVTIAANTGITKTAVP